MRIYRIQHPTAFALTEARSLLFKPDHPRAIDRCIDYFGGPYAAPWTPGPFTFVQDRAHELVERLIDLRCYEPCF